MVIFPNAKINIGLRVGSKRGDGYHNLETLFCPVPLFDALEFTLSASDSDILTVTGNKLDCPDCDNLVLKASSKLREKYGIPPLEMHLHKIIPAGSGLGGGSSDATFLLKALDKYFKLNIPDEELRDIALQLGSDCPFFLNNTPQFATGRGEILRSADLNTNDIYVIIVHEEIHISTAEAFNNLPKKERTARLTDPSLLPFEKWSAEIVNDFEEYAFRLHPQLARIKKSLCRAGAFYSSMTGSGSALYGLFREKPSDISTVTGNIIYSGPLSL